VRQKPIDKFPWSQVTLLDQDFDDLDGTLEDIQQDFNIEEDDLV
jgi:hypothetical protein